MQNVPFIVRIEHSIACGFAVAEEDRNPASRANPQAASAMILKFRNQWTPTSDPFETSMMKPLMSRGTSMARPAVAMTVCMLAACGTVRAATPVAARETIVSQDLQRHVGFLASDTLEGRSAGTRGGHAAATYLAGEFRRLGLTPAGDERDFFQEFGRGYRNVLGLLPGSDPQLSGEIVLLGGHFDHVGYGNRSNSFGPYGQIHNGADDNASGTAAVLEVAEALAQLDQRPARTVLFALWDAEEAGLLGSGHWVRQPTQPLAQVRLALNVDMVGRLRDNHVTVYGVRTAAGLRGMTTLANRDSRLILDFDWTQRDDSDHWSFFQRRVPYLMLFTGYHDDYHRPSDDVPKLNYHGLEHISKLLFELTRAAADEPSSAGFRHESLSEGPAQQKSAERPVTPRSRLGIAWTPRQDPGEPHVITRTVAGSPAERMGLRPGDRIVGVDGLASHEIADLSDYVLSSPGGVTLLVEREGQPEPIELPVTLDGDPVRLGVSWRSDPAEPHAVIVTLVVPGSPAAKTGIQSGDRIYRTNQPEANPTDAPLESRLQPAATPLGSQSDRAGGYLTVPPEDSVSEWLRRVTETAEQRLHLHIERNGIMQEHIIDLLPQRPVP
jgi:hypothetical protein